MKTEEIISAFIIGWGVGSFVGLIAGAIVFAHEVGWL